MKKSELMREKFSERLKQALALNEKDGWGSGSYLKEITGVTQKAANKWLNGESIPNKEKLTTISRRLGVNSAWLEYGEGEIRVSSNEHNNTKDVESFFHVEKTFSYPIVTWNDVEKLIDKRLSSNQFRGKLMSSKNIKNGFWLEVIGNSMWSSSPTNKITFPSGTMILIDPDFEELEPSKFYLIEMPDGSNTFKQLIRDAGQSYLNSLNDNYKPIPINEKECKFLGLVIDRDLGSIY